MPGRRSRRPAVLFAALATAAATALTALCGPAAQAANGYALLTFPDQDHSAVYAFISSATSSVDVTMYELRDTAAVSALVNRQKAGVKVRVVLDGAHTSVNSSAYNALKAAGAGVVYSSSAYVYTHQKTITVDAARSLVMTGNLDAGYYANDRDFGVFDTDPADVAAIERVFAADYARTAVTPTDGDHLVWSPTDSQTRLLALINGARHSLDVEQLEFGDTALVNAVAAAAGRGVAVRVVGMNPSSYGSQFDQVLAAGGRVVTYDGVNGLYVHAKTVTADYGTAGARVFAGSENFSDNSLNHNRELGLIVDDPDVLNGVESAFAADFAGGTPYTG
ncbi:phosphatidylserine/phosphatidylglycerophosphate/cardiolipin synthase family protein [Kitasatospora sp. NPDC088134]|uniref:phospholipase D-like domain-containing protein n=1 Tax=Kitasatospora sp. NPDC088134 TaxID=3364071 RepID=UPI003801C734